MKLERSKNAGKNMVIEIFQKIYGILVPFMQRTLMIIYLGMEYTGLGGLFSSILSVLSLAELGVGSAMVYSMYQAIADDDNEKICHLLNLYKKYYRIIGTVILIIGLIITPFLKLIIKDGTCPDDLNIYILFLMTLASSVLSYWMFAYKASVFSAYQKSYISLGIEMKWAVVFDILQILSLIILSNYYLYLACNIVRLITVNIRKAVKVNKMYPQFKRPKGKLERAEEKMIQRNVKDIFANKLGSVLAGSFDTIVISSFLGLTILARYQNYSYIGSAVMGMTGVVFNATRAGIGNSLVSESKEKNYNDLKIFTFIIFWIITICIVGYTNLFQPFIKVWVGEKNLLGFGVVICLSLYTLTRQIIYLFATYKEASGIWHQDRYRPLISGVINLILNLITVQFWGLYGVILSTVITEALIDIPWLIHNLFTTVFAEINVKGYVKDFVRYFIISAFIVGSVFIICSFIRLDGIVNIIVRLTVSMLLCNIFMILVYKKSDEFYFALNLIKKMVGR